MAAVHAPWGAREKILKIATGEFAARGFAGTTTTAIARAAKVTQPLIHHHFSSKLALWREVVAREFAALDQVIRDALARPADKSSARSRHSSVQKAMTARLSRVVRRLVAYFAEHSDLIRLVRAEANAGGEMFDVLYRDHLEPLIRLFERLVSYATKRGVFRAFDRGFAYFALVGVATQLFAEPALARRAFGIDSCDATVVSRYADFVVETMFYGFGARRTRRPRFAPRVRRTRRGRGPSR